MSSSPAMPPVTNAAPAAAVPASGAARVRFWDRIAPKYAADSIADLAGYETTLRRVQGLLSPSQDVLEIGCGTGSTALRMAPFTRSLLATDVSPAMIAIAHQRLAAQPTPQLRFEVADADAMAFGQGAYDAVLAFNVLHLVSDLDAALALLAQALRPGALLISKTPCLAEMNPLVPHVAVPLMRAIGMAPPVLCFSEQRLHAALAQQGLQAVCAERHGTRGKDIRAFVVARKPG